MGIFINSITKIVKKYYLALTKNTDEDTEKVVNK